MSLNDAARLAPRLGLILLAKKVLLDGRYALRSGRFVELAEEAA